MVGCYYKNKAGSWTVYLTTDDVIQSMRKYNLLYTLKGHGVRYTEASKQSQKPDVYQEPGS